MMTAARIPSRLRPVIDAIIGYDESTPPEAVHFGAPSPAATLILGIHEPVDAAWSIAEPSEQFPGLVAGLHTSPSLIRTHGVQRGIQVSLTPAGVRAVLGLPVAAIAGAMVRLDVIAPELERCRQRLEETDRWAERFALLLAELERVAASHDRHRAIDPFAQRCWDLLLAAGGRGSVSALAEQTGASRRTVTAHLAREMGLGPKEIARVIRFDRSRRLWAQKGSGTLADVAARCGYSDHAHLTREWQALGGQAPSTWEAFPILQADPPTAR